MKRPRRETRWIYRTTTRAIFITVFTFLTTMVVTVQSSHDDLLDVNVPIPEFLPGAVNVTVRQGDVALLPCSVRNLGTKQVAWRRIEGDEFLTIGTMSWSADNNVSLNHSRKPGHVTTWDLVIQHVTHDDAGVYECQVTSRAGHVRNVQLNVVGPAITKPAKGVTKLKTKTKPRSKLEISKNDSNQLSRHVPPGHENSIPNIPVIVCGNSDSNGCLITITGKKYVDWGHRIHLVCNASGGPRIPDEIDWFKGGDKIDSAKYRHVVLDKYQSMADRSFISELIIEHSSLTDTGDYICRSSRNDIANLKVTVLNEYEMIAYCSAQRNTCADAKQDCAKGYRKTETANKRRGTGPGPAMSRNDADDNNGQRQTSCQVSLLTFNVIATLLTLYSSFFGLCS